MSSLEAVLSTDIKINCVAAPGQDKCIWFTGKNIEISVFDEEYFSIDPSNTQISAIPELQQITTFLYSYLAVDNSDLIDFKRLWDDCQKINEHRKNLVF